MARATVFALTAALAAAADVPWTIIAPNVATIITGIACSECCRCLCTSCLSVHAPIALNPRARAARPSLPCPTRLRPRSRHARHLVAPKVQQWTNRIALPPCRPRARPA